MRSDLILYTIWLNTGWWEDSGRTELYVWLEYREKMEKDAQKITQIKANLTQRRKIHQANPGAEIKMTR